MRTLSLLFIFTLVISCQPNSRGFEVSNYIRLLDGDTRTDFEQLSKHALPATIELYNFLDSTSYQLVMKSGGYDKDGNLFDGDQQQLTKIYFEEIDFYTKINQLIELHKDNPNKYNYLKKGLDIPTKIWPEYGTNKVTVSEAYAGLTISKNCVLKSIFIE